MAALVGNSELVTATRAAGSQHLATIGSAHPLAESVFVAALAVTGIIGGLHDGVFSKKDCKGRANDSKKKDNCERMCGRREKTEYLQHFSLWMCHTDDNDTARIPDFFISRC